MLIQQLFILLASTKKRCMSCVERKKDTFTSNLCICTERMTYPQRQLVCFLTTSQAINANLRIVSLCIKKEGIESTVRKIVCSKYVLTKVNYANKNSMHSKIYYNIHQLQRFLKRRTFDRELDRKFVTS